MKTTKTPKTLTVETKKPLSIKTNTKAGSPRFRF